MSISLNDHENRIKSFESKLPDIERRINNIISNGKNWELVSVNGSGGSFTFDTKYNDWNFIVYKWSARYIVGKAYVWQVYADINSASGHSDCRGVDSRYNLSVSFTRSGNVIKMNTNCVIINQSISVIFYK